MKGMSRTGLVESSKIRVRRFKRVPDESSLLHCALARQIPLTLRPFGGLYNPFAKSCSILCNHPAPSDLKEVVKHAKETWDKVPRDEAHRALHDIHENIPEDLFRRYADTASRPMTPTPTVASVRTRTSAGSFLNARRCVTPEPGNIAAKERKQIILDLRRSQSQETLFWNASSELSPSQTGAQQEQQPSSSDSAVRAKKNIRLCEEEEAKRVLELKRIEEANKPTEEPMVCINDKEEAEDEDLPRRRGKKRKKSKAQVLTTFMVSQEPETQIAALGPDSPNQSNRASLIPNGNAAPRMSIINNLTDNVHAVNRASTYLGEDELKILLRGISLDVVEETFDRYMHRALKEAFRTVSPDSLNKDSKALKELKQELSIEVTDHEKWLHMPRRFKRSSARFSIPIKTPRLKALTPITYLSQHVDVNQHNKQLYRFVFSKYLPQLDPNAVNEAEPVDLDKDRTIPSAKLEQALQDVLGFHGSLEKIHQILQYLYIPDGSEINFRFWCGMVAFAERYLNQLPKDEDPLDEIEEADFNLLNRKLKTLNIDEKLSDLFEIIKK